MSLFNSLKSSFLGTTLAQRLPADMEDKVVEFHRFVLRARQRCRYESSQILNMDETLTRFELPATRTLEFTGNQTVPILSCGGNKQSFTVVLAMKADGEKLPPKVIFESRCWGECKFLYTRRPGWTKKVSSFFLIIFSMEPKMMQFGTTRKKTLKTQKSQSTTSLRWTAKQRTTGSWAQPCIQLKKVLFRTTPVLFRTNKSEKVNDQRCLCFVYSFTVFLYIHIFSLAIINQEIWKSYILLSENTRL